MNLADTTPSPPHTTPVIARSNTKAPRSAARAADPPELNALVQQRFRTAAAAYADWPLDRRRAWRAELAVELNASHLSGSFQWDERSVTTKLANLGLRVRPAANDKTPRRDAAVAPARLLDFGAQSATSDDRYHSSSNIADHDAGNSSDKENDACSNGTEPAKQLSPTPLASFLVASQRRLLATAAVARASLSHNGLRGAAHECALATFLRDNCSTSVLVFFCFFFFAFSIGSCARPLTTEKMCDELLPLLLTNQPPWNNWPFTAHSSAVESRCGGIGTTSVWVVGAAVLAISD